MSAKDAPNRRRRRLVHPWNCLEPDASDRGVLPRYTFADILPGQLTVYVQIPWPYLAIYEAPEATSCDVKAGCRKSTDFEGSGRKDAACGESRQGCRGPASRVSPCPLNSQLFREAAGHPVSHKEFLRLPVGSVFCELHPKVASELGTDPAAADVENGAGGIG